MNHLSALSTRFTCISSAPENRKIGRDLAVLLESATFNRNLLGKIFQVLLEYPYGAPWIKSVFKMSEKAIDDNFISLTSPMPRHNKCGDAPFTTWFPNPLCGAASAHALKTLRVNKLSVAPVLTHEFSRLLRADHPLYPATQTLRPISAKNLFAILESIIRLEIYPPGIVAAANFRIDSASPAGPNAAGEAGKKCVQRSRKHHRERRTLTICSVCLDWALRLRRQPKSTSSPRTFYEQCLVLTVGGPSALSSWNSGTLKSLVLFGK
jgi:hypothetical protein